MSDSVKNDEIGRVAESVNDFCLACSISRSHFYEQVRRGQIKILKSGRRTLVPLTERAAYLQRLGEVAQ